MKNMTGKHDHPKGISAVFARATLVAGFLFAAASGFAQTPPGGGGGGGSGPTYTPLNSWSFNDPTNWTSDHGTAPANFTNLAFSYLGLGSSLVVDTNSPAWLKFKTVEASGATNLTVNQGSVLFWFAPGSWSGTNAGGTGPGDYARLFEAGDYTTNSNYGWWSLYVDPAGANLYFSAQTNDSSGTYTNYLSAPISWKTNYFHFVALTYTATNTLLYLDGALATNGPGVTVYPGANALTNGFCIGGDNTGTYQSHGLFNNVQTYNVPMDSGTIADIFSRTLPLYMMSPWNMAISALEVSAQTEPHGGQPLPGTSQSVPDLEAQVAYQRAFEATVWAMPASAIYRMRMGFLELPGMDENVILSMSGPLTPIHEVITGNNQTPYIGATTDLRRGPVVLEVPAKNDKASLYGQIVDAWQATVADVGPAGVDKGAGGKYLLMPPGYKEAIPDGYLPIQSSGFQIVLAFRSVAAPGATEADAHAYSKLLKMYPLSEAANPKPTRFVDGVSLPLRTLPFYDFRTLEDIKAITDIEPMQARDKVMMGMLASLGIERGKPFNPPAKLRAAMERGVVDAYHYMQERTTKLFTENLYWSDRHWNFVMTPDQNRGFEFVTDDAVQIDHRAAAWTFFTFYPRVMSEQAGVVYLSPTADSAGQPLAAGKTYKIHVPQDTPAKQFWSITVYDHATWSFIKNPLQRSGRGSPNKETMKVNTDGSVDVYVGPTAPAGLESNWIPTMGKQPYVWLRLYGPGENFWNKTFKMPDVELVKP